MEAKLALHGWEITERTGINTTIRLGYESRPPENVGNPDVALGNGVSRLF